jgi:hypothetical protein
MRADLSFNEEEFIDIKIPYRGLELLEELRLLSKDCSDEDPSVAYDDKLGEVYDYFNAIGKAIFLNEDIEIYSIQTVFEDYESPLTDIDSYSIHDDSYIIDVDFTFKDNGDVMLEKKIKEEKDFLFFLNTVDEE